MSLITSLKNFFAKAGKVITAAFSAAANSGLTDDLVSLALVRVRDAAVIFVDNTERREWAVAQLVQKGIPESLARLGVELAVQIFKKELKGT